MSARHRARPTPATRALLVALGIGGTLLGGCSFGGPPSITVSAVFSAVSDLVAGAPVQFADLPVGSVQTISLDGDQARVVFTVAKSADVPADVTAELQQTTILGEHYVALVPGPAGGPALANGAVLTRTEVVPGIEQLVSTGTEVFGAVNAAELSAIIDNGAQAFGGQSAQLRQLLDDLGTVLNGYASQSAQIQSVVDEIDQFSVTLAPDAQAGAQSLVNLAQTTQILQQQSTRFVTLLQSLDDLAVQGQSILGTGLGQTEDQIDALSAVADQLAVHQQDLAELLQYLPGANETLADTTVNDYSQVLDDVIVCGIPGGGSDASVASATCDGAGS